MTRLFLVQHGEAKTKDEDSERPLTDRGTALVERIAAWAVRAGVEVHEIRHSGKPRAQQTATILGRHLAPERGVVAVAGLKPKDDVEPLVAELAGRDEPLMLVGHLPFLDRLASRLIAGDPDAAVARFSNAGVVCLEHDDATWSLLWSVTPAIVV